MTRHKALPATRAEAIALGRGKYSTGKPCRSGNRAARYTSNGNCTCPDCREHRRALRFDNLGGPDSFRAWKAYYMRQYRALARRIARLERIL